MILNPIKTDKILPGANTLFEVLDKYLPRLEDEWIVVITSKIVAICEGRTVPIGSVDKEKLIIQESEYFLPSRVPGQGHRTIARHTLVSGAGIDESNANDNYVLLPADSQATANKVRAYLKDKHRLNKIGVLITDSISTPLRIGASGVALGWSGFNALNDYRGKPDLFGREFKVERADVAGGLASAAVLVMGEGSEQTPVAIISAVPFVEFQDRDPTNEELQYMNLSMDEDLFAPLLKNALWQKGERPE